MNIFGCIYKSKQVLGTKEVFSKYWLLTIINILSLFF